MKNYGVAGIRSSPLGPASTTPQRFPKGPFGAELTPTLMVKLARAYPDEMFLGLLSKAPDVDGVGGQELIQVGYRRQAIQLTSRSRSHLTVPHAVLFDIFACPAIAQLALFDSEGVLQAYGVLRPHTTAPSLPTRFEFPSHQILVKRPS